MIAFQRESITIAAVKKVMARQALGKRSEAGREGLGQEKRAC